MKLYYPLTTTLLFAVSTLFAQVDMDKAINLTGSNTDAKVSGIKSVTAAQDAVSAEVLQKGNLVYALATGTGSAYAVALTPAITVYTTGQTINFKANVANTGAVTLNVNGLGAIAIKKNVSADLAAGDIAAGQLVTVVYDGANFQLNSRGNNVGTVTAVTAGNGISSSGGAAPNITLGGTLASNTSINLNGQNLNFSGSGNVGIGTASPGSVLEVAHNGASTFGTALTLNQNQVGNSDGPRISFRKLLTTTPTEKTWSAGILNGVGNTSFAISENGGTGGFGTPQVVIAAGGSVGIGTNGANPVSKLEVLAGNYAVRSAFSGSEPGFQLENTESGGRRWDMFVGSTNTYSAGTTYRGNLFIYDRTSNADRLVIRYDGNVGIGTPNPSQKLEVTGNIMAPLFYDRDNAGYYLDPHSLSNLNTVNAVSFVGSGGTSVVPSIQNVHAVGLLQHHDGNSGYNPNTWHQTVMGDNGTWNVNYQRLYLRRGDGSYTNEIKVQAADGFTSMRELKTNIVPIDKAVYKTYMDKLMNTKIYSYEFKHDPNHIQGLKYIGFIADEVPEEMQSPKKDIVKTGDTFAMMLAAIKLLKEENDKLQERVKALEQKISR